MRTSHGVEVYPRCLNGNVGVFLFTSVEIQCQYDGKEKPIEYDDEGEGTIFLLEVFEE